MKASELRLGNWVTSDGDFFQIDELRPDFIGAGALGIYPAGMLTDECAIPLTEDWLKKFGFIQKPESNSGSPEYFLWIDEDSKCFLEGLISITGAYGVLCVCNGNYFANNLHEAHQLQNLYFALTGNELEIKPGPEIFNT